MLDVGLNPTPGAKIKVDFLIFYVINIIMKNNIFKILFNIAKNKIPAGNARIAATIVYNRYPISIGLNSMKTHPFQKKYGKNDRAICLHAEIDAIKNALKVLTVKELKYCDLYIMRVKKDKPRGKDITGLALPCEGCMRAIMTFDINNVFYSEDNYHGFICI